MRHKPSRAWTPVGLPALRDRVRDAMYRRCTEQDSSVELARSSGRVPPPRVAADIETLRQLIADTRNDARLLHRAELYWVTRDMTQVATAAAPTLPAWTPLAALPCPTGLLCWARPAARTVVSGWDHPDADGPASFDAAFWSSDPSGLRVRLMTHEPRVVAALHGATGGAPLVNARDVLIIDPSQPRVAEWEQSADAFPELSVLAAAWLLMTQPKASSIRRLPGAPSVPHPGRGDPPAVSIIDLRRIDQPPIETPLPGVSRPPRNYRRRWWVDGHWRQQACGPGHAQRKPIWIAPYIKGPEGKPLTDEKVHVWRR